MLRRWALGWSLVHVLGFTLGAWSSSRVWPDKSPLTGSAWTTLTRVSALGPVMLTATLGPASGLVWTGIFLCGVQAGRMEALERNGRRSLVCESPWVPSQSVSREGLAIVRVTGWPLPAGSGRWRFPARLLRYVPGNGSTATDKPLRGDGLLLSVKERDFPPGSILTGHLKLRVPGAPDLPGEFDYRQYLRGRDIRWTGQLVSGSLWPGKNDNQLVVRFFQPVRQFLLSTLDTLYPAAERDLAQAVLLGARSGSSRQASRPFADLGLAHLFAVSGLHVGILLGILLIPARQLDFPPWATVLLLALTLPVYMVLTGLPGSVVRAALLAFLGAAAGLAGRRADALHMLGLLFWGTTIWFPGQVLDTGVRLSYLAAGGILLVARHLSDTPLPWGGFGKAVLIALGVSLAAIWFTFPQAALSFGRLPLLAPVANLVAVPLFGFGVWGLVLSLLASGIPGPVAEYLSALTWLLLRGLSGLVAIGANRTPMFTLGLGIPGPGLVLTWMGCTVLMGISLVRRPRFWPVLVVGCLLAVPAFSWWQGRNLRGNGSVLQVTLFDVGQGDASLVVFPDGWTALIDTGGRFGFGSTDTDGPLSRKILPFLTRAGLRRVDAVILTHDHLDHTGGNRALARQLEVGTWYCGGHSRRTLPRGPALSTTSPVTGRILHEDGAFSLRMIFAPGETDSTLHENDRSLVAGLFHGEQGLMAFSGDLEVDGEALLLGRTDCPGPFQAWKAGHHGSGTSGSADFLKRLQPGLVLISCGVDNKYRHPSHGAYTVASDTLPQVRTDLEGSIFLTWDSQGRGRWQTSGQRGHLSSPP